MWWPKYTRCCIKLYFVLLQVFYHICTLMPTYFFKWRILPKGQSYFKKGYFSKKWLKIKTSNQQNLSFFCLKYSDRPLWCFTLNFIIQLKTLCIFKITCIVWGLWAWHVKHEWNNFFDTKSSTTYAQLKTSILGHAHRVQDFKVKTWKSLHETKVPLLWVKIS